MTNLSSFVDSTILVGDKAREANQFSLLYQKTKIMAKKRMRFLLKKPKSENEKVFSMMFRLVHQIKSYFVHLTGK